MSEQSAWGSRRDLLRLAGLGVGFAGAAALTKSAVAQSASIPAAVTDAQPLTVASWRTDEHVYVAHRGSGDVYPEHSMVAYQAAVDWGATCMEISVAITSDGVLICLHDDTYDRTTTGTGRVVDLSAAAWREARISEPRLGAAWVRHPPPIPLFEDVLRRFGGSVILCVEAKVDAAYEPMMALVERLGLRDSVFVKMHFSSRRLEQAQAAGYPIFSYLGNTREVSLRNIDRVRQQLRPESDVLVIAGLHAPPRFFIADELVRAAVDTGIPIWVFPIHRRSEADHFRRLGVRGAVCSSFGYVAEVTDPVSRDHWSEQRVAPGEISISPATDTFAPDYTSDGRLVLAAQGGQQFLLMGQFCPIPAAAESYTIQVDVRWAVQPGWDGDGVSLAFGHDDDQYYQHRLGVGTGYHLLLRYNGELALYAHDDGGATGTLLGAESGPPMQPGQWVPLQIRVTTDLIEVGRTGADTVVIGRDARSRGGYFHLGRTSTSGIAEFRSLRVG